MSFYTLVNITPITKLSNKISKQVSMASHIAENSDFKSSKRLGASLQKKGTIFYGANYHRKSHSGKSHSLHAEINVLIQALKRIEKNATLKSKIRLPSSTVCVVRLLKDTNNLPSHRTYRFGISKPCRNCEPQLYKFNVTKILYTDIIEGEEVLCELKRN